MGNPDIDEAIEFYSMKSHQITEGHLVVEIDFLESPQVQIIYENPDMKTTRVSSFGSDGSYFCEEIQLD
jgi:hypothetical protein